MKNESCSQCADGICHTNFGLEEDLESFSDQPMCQLDLALADLAGKIKQTRLRGADLFGIKLNKADLSEAELG